MTEVTYNGVRFTDVETEQITQDQQFDDGNVDPLYVKTEVTIIGTVHVQTVNPHLGFDGGSDLASGLSMVEAKLLTPRRPFVMKINGSTLFEVYPTAVEPGVRVKTAASLRQADVNNGPRARITTFNIINGKSARVRITFSLAIPNCDSTDTNGVLSMRWWITDDIDCDSWLTTRTYEGYVRLASRNVTPHAYRNFVLPPLVTSFKRSRISFKESEDGLTLRFAIIDDQWVRVPPSPATHWKGTFTASSPTKQSCIWYADLTVTLTGPPDVSMEKLHALAKKVADAKIRLTERLNNGSAMSEHIAYQEALEKNQVTWTVRMMYLGEQTEVFNMVKGDMGHKDIPGISSTAAANPIPTASMKGVLLAALQTACRPGAMPKPTGAKLKQSGPAYQDDSEPVVVDEGTLDSWDTLHNLDSQKENPITVYKCTSDYRVKGGRVSLPTGKSSKAGEATAAVVSLHRGSAIRTVRIEGQRIDKWPVMPDTSDFVDENGIRHTLIDWRPMLHQSTVSADGRKTLHMADVELVYAMSRAPNSLDSLSVGGLPYLQRLPVEKQVYPSNEYVSAQSLLTSKRGLVARR